MREFSLPIMKYSEQKELISIIVPICNTKKIHLKECLDSILVQTFSNWKAILVNDGSTDDTRETIDEYTKRDSRFIAIHKQNEGTLLSRKVGLENSKGEFVANIDHDDTYHP
jgi:glycosyltransferase involved in cell wall biosynthesis